jgi:hypothetical protein
VCEYSSKGSSAKQSFAQLIADGSEFKTELETLFRYLKFPGTGQRETPVMDIMGLQRLLMILGSKVAAEVRELVADTFTRVAKGDMSLIEVVIKTKAVYKAPKLDRSVPVDPAVVSKPDVLTESAAAKKAAVVMKPTADEKHIVDDVEDMSEEALSFDEPTVVAAIQQFDQMICNDLGDRIDMLYAEWEKDETQLMEHAAKQGKVFYGNCYACYNPVYPHLVKIGWTGRDPMQRLRELAGAGVPEPFVLLASINCYNPQDVEKTIHNHFDADRKYGRKKEFFLSRKLSVGHYFEFLKHKLAGIVHVQQQVPRKRKMEEMLMKRMVSLEEQVERMASLAQQSDSRVSELIQALGRKTHENK